MKFLFDQSADFRLIAHLRELGHDVSAISREHPPGLADKDVLAIARNEKRILLVADRDFGELIFHHRRHFLSTSRSRPSDQNRTSQRRAEHHMTGMMWGMGLIWVLVIIVLVLGAVALLKYLFSGE
jgi:hypothetical protein